MTELCRSCGLPRSSKTFQTVMFSTGALVVGLLVGQVDAQERSGALAKHLHTIDLCWTCAVRTFQPAWLPQEGPEPRPAGKPRPGRKSRLNGRPKRLRRMPK